MTGLGMGRRVAHEAPGDGHAEARRREVTHHVSAPSGSAPAGYAEWDDKSWDAFVRDAPGGSYRQSSGWGHVKATQGWETRRVAVRRGGRLLAGVQLLSRPLPLVPSLGSVAYAARGPVTCDEDPLLARRVMADLARHCRRWRIRVLIVQPPEGGASLEEHLRDAGCVPSPLPVAPRASVLVDLAPDLDAIEQRLSPGLRKKLRRAERRGMQVRTGDRDDIVLFHRLLTVAARRLGFSVFPAGYYHRLWDAFVEVGQGRLFIAEREGHAVSAVLCVTFGDRVVSTVIGWSGEDGALNPNDLLDWHTIRWAKTQGHRYVELENLDHDLARRLIDDDDPTGVRVRGSDRYKLKWSTEVVLHPPPYLYLPNPLARALLRAVPPRLLQSTLQRLATRFRP